MTSVADSGGEAMKRVFLLGVVWSLASTVGAVAWADAPPGRYTITSDTVRDNRTGLTWQRSVPWPRYRHDEAISYCEGLVLAGSEDWRLPSVNELLSIVDPTRTSPAADVAAFAATPGDWFWTVSPYVDRSGSAWSVLFATGVSDTSSILDRYFVRCVR